MVPILQFVGQLVYSISHFALYVISYFFYTWQNFRSLLMLNRKGGPGASGRVLPPVTGRSWVRVAVSLHCTGEGKAYHWHPSPDPAQSGSSLHWVRPLLMLNRWSWQTLLCKLQAQIVYRKVIQFAKCQSPSRQIHIFSIQHAYSKSIIFVRIKSRKISFTLTSWIALFTRPLYWSPLPSTTGLPNNVVLT